VNIIRIHHNDTRYPNALRKYYSNEASPIITAIGDIDILQNKTLAVLCSNKCPGSIILETYDLMRDMRNSGVAVISGFHSPIEKECLNILLKGKQPVIICSALGYGLKFWPEEFQKLKSANPHIALFADEVNL
jgi:predicted Rossmann fold nucleotide-binding protein DprA/Smf involved in DNA uptake